GTFKALDFREGEISYGNFLFASALTHTGNPGFNFSPFRDLSEAVFWNSSAIVNSRKPNNISLLTNVKNNGKVSCFFKINDKISLGAGAIYTVQDEFRVVRFANISNDQNIVKVDSFFMKAKEYAVFLSPSIKLNDKLSLGVSVKSIWQNFKIPNILEIDQDDNGATRNIFTDSSIKKQNFDVDLSITYKLSKSFQVGLNAMNLAGTKLHADAFVPGQQNLPYQNQRSFGLGLCYKWQRFNFGADILFTEDDFYDAAFGVNYVPFNDALICVGLAVKELSYSIAFRLKHFRLAYIDDNDWLVNEKRKGKSGLLNGRLYGGFSFDF
ncbi:MAG TPA: conjugal transfer protein TraF, partial [Chitinophagaceae bacterium]|nr:conjugal transfer protein TraF [Chitinophagaceae bacterium]